MKKIISCVLIVFVILLSACSSDKPVSTNPVSAPEAKADPEHMSITVLGDNLMHMPVVNSGKKDDGSYEYSHIFKKLQPYIKDSDIAVIGQETIFAGADKGYSGYPMFNTPSDVGKSLVNEGFDIVLHASNHTMDRGIDGINYTINFWKQYPEVKVVGINETHSESTAIKAYTKSAPATIKIGIPTLLRHTSAKERTPTIPIITW